MIDARDSIRALPRVLLAGDYFTGAATFHKVMKAAVRAIRRQCPKESKNLKDWDYHLIITSKLNSANMYLCNVMQLIFVIVGLF